MKKKLFSVLLAGVMSLGAFGISSTVGFNADGEEPALTVTADDVNYFLKDGKTDYKIVVSANPSANTDLAVAEFKDLFRIATGIVLKSVKDSDVATYDADQKYICIGENAYSEKAGVTVDSEKLGMNGYRVVTKGNSAFLLGGGSWGDIWAVYDFLEEQIGYHCYFEDELYFDESKLNTCQFVSLDKEDKPDIEWRLCGDGEGYVSKDVRIRLRLQENYDAWMTSANVSFGHNYFQGGRPDYGYVPWRIMDSHTKDEWFNSLFNCLCFSRDIDGLSDQVLSVCKDLITTLPEMESLIFTQLDTADWCYCTDCAKIMNGIGDANSPVGSEFPFLQMLGKKMGDWVEKTYHGTRDIKLYIYAYWVTKNPPSKPIAQIKSWCENYWETIENDKQGANKSGWADGMTAFVKGLDHVFPDNIGIQYCCGFFEKNPMEDISEKNVANKWAEITDNWAVYDYNENFAEYLAPCNIWNKVVPNTQFFYEKGATIYYDLMAYDNLCNSDWARLHMYLEAQVEWDCERNFNDLVDDFMAHYYYDAAEYMSEWFYTERAYMTQVGAGASASFPLGLCQSFLSLAEKAFNSILKYKYSNPELYTKLYDRINLETIAIRYLILRSYTGSVGDTKEYASKLKNDCSYFGIQRNREASPIDNFFASYGV